MPIRYRYDAAADLVCVESTGVIPAAVVHAYYAAVAREPWLRPGMRFLADNRGVRTLPPSAEIESAAFAAVRAAAYVGSALIAVIVPDAAQFGVIRQFQAFSEEGGATMRPFYGEDEALAWLGASSGPPGQHSAPPHGDKRLGQSLPDKHAPR